MNVSFVIPAINEHTNIQRAVCAAWDAGAAEVIVVDGGSTDGTVEIAQGLDCQLVCTAPGRANQQNAGAQRATGEVLVFQHADTRFCPDAVAQIRAAMTSPEVRFGAFWQHIEAQGVRFRLLEWGNASRVRRLGVAYGDQGIFVVRDLFMAIGGFPEEPLLEDLLLLRNLRRSGWPVLLPGPLHISARRWQEYGCIRQTLRNWLILTLNKFGCSPESLARLYARHDARPA